MNSPDAQPSTPVLSQPDRRRYPRCTVQVQIEIRQEGDDVPMRVETTDLSRGGCSIELMMPLSVGGRVQAKLWLDGQPIVVRGRVVTRHPEFGNGIMFLEFEGEGEQILKRYLAGVVIT